MPRSESFFSHIATRLEDSHNIRSYLATDLYNQYVQPRRELTPETADWFSPWSRLNYTRFTWGDLTEDLSKLLFNPILFLVLAEVELKREVLCIPAALGQLIKLNPAGFVYNVIDFIEAEIASFLLVLLSLIEVVVQLASLAMRTVATLLHCVGADVPSPAPVNDRDSEEAEPAFISSRIV